VGVTRPVAADDEQQGFRVPLADRIPGAQQKIHTLARHDTADEQHHTRAGRKVQLLRQQGAGGGINRGLEAPHIDAVGNDAHLVRAQW